MKIFLYSSSMYYCHLYLISSASVRSIPFLSFIVPIFVWNIPLVCLIFLKRSLVLPMLLFSSISLHWSLRKAFLSFLAILWNSEFRWIVSFLISFAFCFSFLSYLWVVLITASCTMLWTSIHSSSGTLSTRASVLHFVFHGQTCLLLQVSLDFLYLHSCPLWWKGRTLGVSSRRSCRSS